jgi:branched-chain amino acid transport system substrate-binding protein
MSVKRNVSIAAPLALAAAFAATGAQAQISGGVVKIGVLSDMSSLYSDIGGGGSAVAARLAIDDFAPSKRGMKVELLSADHL